MVHSVKAAGFTTGTTANDLRTYVPHELCATAASPCRAGPLGGGGFRKATSTRVSKLIELGYLRVAAEAHSILLINRERSELIEHTRIGILLHGAAAKAPALCYIFHSRASYTYPKGFCTLLCFQYTYCNLGMETAIRSVEYLHRTLHPEAL